MPDFEDMSITVTENGPYMVKGDVPLFEVKITYNDKDGYAWEILREIEHEEIYALCRCGKSKDAPFCDSESHKRFKGKEKADRRTFDERCQRSEGPDIILEDDLRCSMSRFCHRKKGSIWELLPKSDDPEIREEVIRGSLECPSGRVQIRNMDGSIIDERPEPAIWIIQDPNRMVSGGIYVMGGIPIISADGFEYEPRNRAVLCRCGVSDNMPFCDSKHINNMYKDDRRRRR